MVEPIRINSLATEAFDRVVEVITSGAYAPGQKLSESELARQLGISRGPVREALQRLEGRLIERIPRIGVRLLRLDAAALRQLFLIREALEGLAARLAAQQPTQSWIDTTARMLERHRRAVENDSSGAYRQAGANEDFHFAVARAANCPSLERVMLNEVYYQLRLHRIKSSTAPGRAQQALKEHHAIFDAICAGDADGAEQRMRAHIAQARGNTLLLAETDPAP